VAYVPLSRFLFRAPLLPSHEGTPAHLLGDPLGKEAIRIASPELAAALLRPKREAKSHLKSDSKDEARGTALSLGRYSRRAAFRATPNGLLAGIGIGQLGRTMRVATGKSRAAGRISLPRLHALARALLTDAGMRQQTRLRLGPSVMVSGDKVVWLGSTGADGFVKETRSAIDEVVGAVLEVASAWTPWIVVRGAVMARLARLNGAQGETEGEEVFAGGSEREDEAGPGEADDDDETVAESIDDVLLTMLDDGFLHSDLTPPLIGPRPCAWMQERLSGMTGAPESWEVAAVFDGDLAELRARLAAATHEAGQGHFEIAREILATLPEHPLPAGRPGTHRAIDAVLHFDDSPHVTLPVNVVTRACALAPILFRLQEALTPPIRERAPGPAMAEALDAATEIFGAGAFDLRALATGEYGVAFGPERRPRNVPDEDGGDGSSRPGTDDGNGTDEDDDAPGAGSAAGAANLAAPRLLTLLVDRIAAASRAGEVEIHLSSEQLDELLPAADAPGSCELFLTPPGEPSLRRAAPSKAKDGPAAASGPGWGWLLGLHAPAGSSWGRFAHALSDVEQAQLFEPLVAAERETRPGESCVDVAFAPDVQLGDLCSHPAFREGALAITHWPQRRDALDEGGENRGTYGSVSTALDLELVAEPAAGEPLALRHGVRPLSPSPFHRVRSTTAPPGMWRLLTGWSLYRQHRPWAMLWGGLSDLEHLPRVRLDGFVIAPASWRLPPDVVRDLAGPSGNSRTPAAQRRFSEWRRGSSVPRQVQVGSEDELLPVDLDSADAAVDLRGHDRVFEIWPPLADTPDEQGRRVEAVIALVDHPDGDRRARLESDWARVSRTGLVPPPHLRQPGEDGAGWTTYKLFGLAETQAAILAEIVAPAVAAARDAKEISSWFFQRYVDPPGRRAHLRVRVHGDGERMAARLEAEVEQTAARARGQIVSIERTPYFPESARYGGRAGLPAIHRLFEVESDLICACLASTEAIETEASSDESPADMDEQATMEPGLFHLVLGFDTLTRGLGWSASARQTLAAQRRHAHAEEIDTSTAELWAAAFRRAKPRLRAWLLDGGPRLLRTAFANYERAVVEIAGALASEKRDEIIASLLHVSAVRWLGADRLAELQGYTFWERTLESLAHHRSKPARSS
jgi:lantibiotic biosynthesis protein